MPKDKQEVIEGEVVDEEFSLSGGLVPVPEQEAPVVVEGLTSDGEGEEIGPSWIRINQDIGGFDVDGEHFDALYVSILARKLGYTRFKRDENGQAVLTAPLCKSIDRATGAGDPGGSCAACKLKDWPENSKKKPECSQTCVLFLALDVGQPRPEPMYLPLKGTSIAPTNAYFRTLGRRYRNNLWRPLTKITTVAENWQGGKKYYVVAFEEVKGKDFLTVPAVQPMLAQLKAQLEAGFVRTATEHDGGGAAEY